MKMQEIFNKKLRIDCACTDFGHSFRFIYDDVDDEVFLEASLPYDPSFFNRVKTMFRYLFRGAATPYGYYDVTYITLDKCKDIVQFLNEIIKQNEHDSSKQP